MKKILCVTSDIVDDLFLSNSILSEDHIDSIMHYAASLGANRFEWVFDTLWTLYDTNSPMGYDLLRVACHSAHRHGMRFDVVYKPFESGIGPTLPSSFPKENGDRIIETENGILSTVRKFVAENLHFRIGRRKGDGNDPGGKLNEIRLIKFDEGEILFQPQDISFWYSETNGNFTPYEGKLEISITKEWRLGHPYDDKLSTIIHFKGFNLPEQARFIEVRCSKLDVTGSFSNHIESIVELINEFGDVIPCAPSTLHPNWRKIQSRLKRTADLGLSSYLNKPEVRVLLRDFDNFSRYLESNSQGMYVFEPQWEIFTLDRVGSGVIAVCRGKPLFHPVELHPIYPEVRDYWLNEIQYCIDRGVDGVNIRVSRHGGVNEPWAYGFNDAVIERLKNKDSDYEAALVNGQAFDTFLQDAATLLHANHKELGIHLCGLILRQPDRKMATTKPSNFAWNWQHWINDLADYAEFHKANFFKFQHTKEIVDHFSYLTNRIGKPLIYQSGQSSGVTHFSPPHHFLPFEMQWVKSHPHINCYNLYETASFFRLNENGAYEGSPHIKKLIQEFWD